MDSRLGISKGVPITFSAHGTCKSQGGDVPVHATKTYTGMPLHMYEWSASCPSYIVTKLQAGSLWNQLDSWKGKEIHLSPN